MTDPVDDLVLDLLEWLAPLPRPYTEVMEAWRTSCPRLTVWEDANESGFLERSFDPGHGPMVAVSASGHEYLRANRPALVVSGTTGPTPPR
ncbi:MAG TPA: hypothetical protein VFJ79_09110 [Acidimicrobiales bacterium]|nr:hypothetical protein [Acidimicrobiales bacterium]